MSSSIDISTQGIKYTGSKLKLLPYILGTIDELKVETILDGFSGTTRVSQALAQRGYEVTCADVSVWSETFGKCYLMAKKEKKFYQKIIDELNALDGRVGWFTENYSIDKGDINKAPFQTKNLMKLDAIRERINELNLEEVDKAVLLTSLILALDKVDNTLGHFSSYLAKWSPRSYNNIFLTVPDYKIYKQQNRVIKDDIFNIVGSNEFDLAYFDPPYGSNNEKMPPSRVRYASYYHFWTSVILNDKPKLFGKVHRREDTRDLVASSVFEEYKKDKNGKYIATEAIRKLANETNAKYIIFSYSNGGRATKDELNEIFNSCGKLLKVIEIDYKANVMSTMKWTNEWLNGDRQNVEYLFVLEKSPVVRPAISPILTSQYSLFDLPQQKLSVVEV